MEEIKDESVALVVTSPPYPMIEMWNETFSQQDSRIGEALMNNDGMLAFNLMHEVLEKVWDEVNRVLMPGGIACINIGDATKTINDVFQIYPNHVKIINYFMKLGFLPLPDILWRKPTNAPNKFMGSGTLPPGAYVTLEHEYILILRKGSKREFKTEREKQNRRESAYFWEERNVWFSDVWDVKGISQKLKNKEVRERTGAFPFEIAYRLINMFSVKGDWVLDPFLGTGTTAIAAVASERNSIGYEIEKNLKDIIINNIVNSKDSLNEYIESRLQRHINFMKDFKKEDELKYLNKNHGFYVNTKQELDIKINKIDHIAVDDEKNEIFAEYVSI